MLVFWKVLAPLRTILPPLIPAQPRFFVVPLPLMTPLNVTVIPLAWIVLSVVPPLLAFPVKVRSPVPGAPRISEMVGNALDAPRVSGLAIVYDVASADRTVAGAVLMLNVPVPRAEAFPIATVPEPAAPPRMNWPVPKLLAALRVRVPVPTLAKAWLARLVMPQLMVMSPVPPMSFWPTLPMVTVLLALMLAGVPLLLIRAPVLLKPVPFTARATVTLLPLRSSAQPPTMVVAPEPSADALPSWSVTPVVPKMRDVPPL